MTDDLLDAPGIGRRTNERLIVAKALQELRKQQHLLAQQLDYVTTRRYALYVALKRCCILITRRCANIRHAIYSSFHTRLNSTSL